MSLLALPIIAVVALVISVFCLVGIFILSMRHKAQVTLLTSQYQAQELIVNNLQLVNEELGRELSNLQRSNEKITIENTQVSKQLEHRINTLQTHVNNQDAIIEQLQSVQGNDKFYSRAIKLAEKGADIDEIVTECELPYAEVEMLIAIYQKKTSS